MSERDPVADLTAAAEALSATRERVAEVGTDRLETVADAHGDLLALLDRHEEDATGYGEFGKYIEFQEALAERLDALPEDVPASDAFDAADEALQKRTLSASDFDHARTALAPAAEYADLAEEWAATRERYRDARRAVIREKRAAEDRVADLERLRRLAAADPDAPVEVLHDPVAAYDDAVRTAFERFTDEASARAVLAFVERTRAYPLVPFDPPPERLRAFVADAPVGEEPLDTLLAYADYSTSKLDHYVADPRELKAAVSTNRTYLDRLDATPLTVGWPPPSAATLRWRTRELVPVVARFADADVVARLRAVRSLTRREDYGSLRESAVARSELTDADRERLADVDVEHALAQERAERDRLADALATHPPLDDVASPA
ncbi:DUF7118 family protein [Halomarina ordinaria]|uniref:DUF530 domain-containing protein n=1 Tax=Halomarina ordinaria TaxID=3033939 RepID=A0ABD5UGC7_9EURY|nr:hypothetical protein [Halomarina sp. PSRA2]